jgi:hypothetical protein
MEMDLKYARLQSSGMRDFVKKRCGSFRFVFHFLSLWNGASCLPLAFLVFTLNKTLNKVIYFCPLMWQISQEHAVESLGTGYFSSHCYIRPLAI